MSKDEENIKKDNAPKKRVLLAPFSPCVHELGLESFLEELEYVNLDVSGLFLGTSTPEEIIGAIQEVSRPGLIVGLSYRLGDKEVERIIVEFITEIFEAKLDPKNSGIRYAIAGMVPAANLIRAITGHKLRKDPFAKKEQHHDLKNIAEKYKNDPRFQNFFELIADTKTKSEEIADFAEPQEVKLREKEKPAQNLIDRITQGRKRNRVPFRVHLGAAADSLKPTIDAIKKISKDGDHVQILSLAPDQPTQEHLWHFITKEEKLKNYPTGQGGCPIRSEQDLKDLYEATQCGNYPLARIYSGTDELIKLAKLFIKHLKMNKCFPAVPLFWYSKLDQRGPIAIREGIEEHQRVIKFWAEKGAAVELNDPHQWQLLKSSDTAYVVDHLICAIVAKMNGVKNYVMQMMFNLPPRTSPVNDLAKMKAALELIETLEDKNFRVIRETRSGLSSFPDDLDEAAGHLAYGVGWQFYLDPDIVHVVSKNEAHHESDADDIIASCKIVRAAEKEFRKNAPYIWGDMELQKRKLELQQNAIYTLLHIALLGGFGKGKGETEYKNIIGSENFDEFLKTKKECKKAIKSIIDKDNYPGRKCGVISSDALELTIRSGLLQAPSAVINDQRYEMINKCRTRVINGACRTIEFNGEPITNEIDRVNKAWIYFKENIESGKIAYKGKILERGIPKETVYKLRDKINIHKFKNKKVIVLDIGSTYTKVSTFNTTTAAKTGAINTRKVPTTVDDVRICLANGLDILNKCLVNEVVSSEKLDQEIEKEIMKYDIRFACSSAKGGLKIVTISAVEGRSGRWAVEAAHKAGGKILNSYNGKLTIKQIKDIYQKDQPELILLAGGVDKGGNQEIVIHNTRKIAEYAHLANEYAPYGVPVVYAGTIDARNRIAHIFNEKNVDVKITDNIMPEINKPNVDAVEEAISELFSEIIIKGKGFDKIQKYFSSGLIPTPLAALWAANLLACGYGEDNPGIGNIFAIDSGGATTDVFRILFEGNPLYKGTGEDKDKRTLDQDQNLPPVARRVEGKLGLSYSAINIMLVDRWKKGKIQAFINSEFKKIYPDYKGKDDSILSQFFNSKKKKAPIDIASYLEYLSKNPNFIPTTKEGHTLNALITNEILKAATKNNCGKIKPGDIYLFQTGMNFSDLKCTVLLIGGSVHHKCQENTPEALQDLKIIAKGALYDPKEPYILRPKEENVTVLADADYIVSILGLLARVAPKHALQIMKKHLKEIKLD